MSKRVKVCIAVMAVVMAAAVVPASLVSLSAGPAGASTTACGGSCASPSVQSLGTGQVLAVSGSSVVMAAASTSNSGEDWTVQDEGSVPNAVASGVLSSKLNMLYSSDDVVEYQYAPNGVPSGQCLANTATNNPTQLQPYNVPTLTVVLAQCGLTAQSLWIMAAPAANGYLALINAGYEATFSYLAPTANGANTLTSPFAEPAVLTVNSSGKVVLAQLSEIGGVVSPTQMWANYLSPSQSALRAKTAKAG